MCAHLCWVAWALGVLPVVSLIGVVVIAMLFVCVIKRRRKGVAGVHPVLGGH